MNLWGNNLKMKRKLSGWKQWQAETVCHDLKIARLMNGYAPLEALRQASEASQEELDACGQPEVVIHPAGDKKPPR